jgi:hypothetical protein
MKTGNPRCRYGWLALVLTASCGGNGDRVSPYAQHRDSAGVDVVENHGEGKGLPFRIAAVPTVRIGEVETADSSKLLTRVQGAVHLSDGRIVVLERESGQVRWFDRSGEHLLTRGGRGRGPQEVGLPMGLVRLHGDSVAVIDGGFERLIFDSTGAFVRLEELDRQVLAANGPLWPCATLVLPDRSFFRCRRADAASAGISGSDPAAASRNASRLLRLTGTLDSIVELGHFRAPEQRSFEYNGERGYVTHPFFSTAFVASDSRGTEIAVALNPDYEIEFWSVNGRLVRIVRRHDALRTPAERERDLAREEFLAPFRIFRDDALLAVVLRAVPEPATLPAVQGLVIAASGDLWVQRHIPRYRTDPSAFDVFDTMGEFLGTMAVPAGFAVLEVGDDYVLGVMIDEADVPFVELYDIMYERRTNGR